jgi:hypothetical protein
MYGVSSEKYYGIVRSVGWQDWRSHENTRFAVRWD